MLFIASCPGINPRHSVWVIGLSVILFSNRASASRKNSPLPGDPMNPRDFALGKQYQPPYNIKQERSKEWDQTVSPTTWPNGRIPYLISNQFNRTERSIIASAATAFRPRTCITFEPRTKERDYVLIVKGSMDCYSQVGMVGKAQVLNLSPSCMNRGGVIHEFAHAVGFNHEHQRKDRNKYIRIVKRLVRKDLLDQMLSIRSKAWNTLTRYDYGSILHYPDNADCIKNCPQGAKTIIKLNQTDTTELGQDIDLSRLDIERTNILYRCKSRRRKNFKIIMDNKAGKYQECTDFTKGCSRATTTDCRSNTWVKFMCRKSCNLCESPNCEDYNETCEEWSTDRHCFRYPEYMLMYCRKACNVC